MKRLLILCQLGKFTRPQPIRLAGSNLSEKIVSRDEELKNQMFLFGALKN